MSLSSQSSNASTVSITEYDEDIHGVASNILKVIGDMHQELYNTCGLTSSKSLQDIMKIFIIKLLGREFNTPSSKLYNDLEEKRNQRNSQTIEICKDIKKFNTIELNKPALQIWKSIIDIMVSILPNIYTDNDKKFNFEIKTQKEVGEAYDILFKKLIKKTDILDDILGDINDEDCEKHKYNKPIYGDVIGRVYEYFRNKYGGNQGKDLGQYFTPRELIDAMISGLDIGRYLKDQVKNNPEFKEPKCYDPTSGTFGMLMRAYTKLPGMFKPENIHGNEIESDTIKFGFLNTLLTTGELCDIKLQNSLTTSIDENSKFHMIISNPPFGIKMNYKDLEKSYNDDKTKCENKREFKKIYPEKSSDGAILFVQQCLNRLETDGVLGIVLPYGNIFTGKSNTKFRKWMMENFNLEKLMIVPGGVFEHTTITTCVMVLKNNGSTKTVQLSELSKDCKTITETNEISFEEIKSKNYDLNTQSYIKEEVVEREDCVYKKLGELFDLKSTTKHKTSLGNDEGKYRFYNSSMTKKLYLNTYEEDEVSIILGNGGEFNVHIDTRYTLSKHATGMTLKNSMKDNVDIKYVYYSLLNNQRTISKLYTGVAIKWMNKEDIKSITIPIPSLEKQKEIVEYCESLEEELNLSEFIKFSDTNIVELILEGQQEIIEQVKTLYLNTKHTEKQIENYRKQQEATVKLMTKKCENKKTLGEVCVFQNGYAFKSNELNSEGEVGVVKIKDVNDNRVTYETVDTYVSENTKLKQFELNEGDCVVSLTGTIVGKFGILTENKKLYINQRVAKITSVVNEMCNKYLYTYCMHSGMKKIITNKASGAAQKNISTNELSKIKIVIPSLEIQEKIVKKCEYYDRKIEELKNEIEENKEMIKIVFE